jgi:hypothetical protein
MEELTSITFSPTRTNNDREDTYTESVARRYMNKLVDIYMGDGNGTHCYLDYEINKTAFIRGTIIGVDCYALFITALAKTNSKEVEFEMALNSYNIKAICPVKNLQDRKFNISKLFIDQT